MTGAYRISSQFPLGVLGGGVLATVNQSAVLYIAGLEVRVAIRTERGWQRIEELANLRLGPVGAVPILQGVARIDGGEVRIRFAAGATPDPAVLLEVKNQTPVPIAVALVVSGEREMTVHRHGVDIAGRPAIQIGRPVRGGRAGSAEEVMDSLIADKLVNIETNSLGMSAAIVAGVAHSTALTAIVGASTPWDSSPWPSIDQVQRGWERHLDGRCSLVWPGSSLPLMLSRSIALSLLGVEVGAATCKWARAAEVWYRAEFPQLCTGVVASLWDDQRRNGWIGSTDEVRDVEALMRATWASTWGGDIAEAASVASRVMKCVRFARRTGRLTPTLQRAGAGIAIALGQLDLASEIGWSEHLALEALVSTVPVWQNSHGEIDLRMTAESALECMDRAVHIERVDGRYVIDLLPGGVEPGVNLDIERFVVPGAVVSAALRWHGDRPAWLWECHSVDHAAEIHLRSTGLDPNWEVGETTGEALLSPVSIPTGFDQQ